MTLIGSFNMKDYKDPKKTPDKIEESFAYDGGIGEPDKNWQRNMEIDEHPTKEKEEDDSEEKKINDDSEVLGDAENTNHSLESHERFLNEDDPIRAEKPFEIDPTLRDVDKW